MIVGILNVTPDSFSDGGRYVDVVQAVQHAIGMLQEGAEVIDVGGESTKPGSARVSEEEELRRVLPVISALRETSDCLISIDTSKAEVARLAIEAGADIVNDVTGLMGDAKMAEICAQAGVGVIVMHMQGCPESMQRRPEYGEVLGDVRKFFEERYRELTQQGINPLCLCFDPGIGFGKTLEHNLKLLHGLSDLRVNERPLMLGVSRKSMVAAVLEDKAIASLDAGTMGLTSLGRMAGAELHRVHAVGGNYEAMRMAEAVLNIDV